MFSQFEPKKTNASSALLVGTSGYSYSEWIESGFYPHGVKPAKMLALYASVFDATELNHTWYQMPRAEASERQRQLAPPDFKFCVKLTRTMTHEVDAEAWKAQAQAFRYGVAPLVQSGQLAAVMAQFPQSFERSNKSRRPLAALLDELYGLPMAVEFRSRSWVNDKVFAELERRKVTLVAVDEPALPGLFPSIDEVTNPDLLYVRFHGRNAKGWHSGKMSSQFDYDYSDDELNEWLDEKLRKMMNKARRGVIFFNNHVKGQAPKNALTLSQLISKSGLSELKK